MVLAAARPRPVVAVVSAMRRKWLATSGEPAVLEPRLGSVRGAALGDPGVGADDLPGLQGRDDVVGLLARLEDLP